MRRFGSTAAIVAAIVVLAPLLALGPWAEQTAVSLAELDDELVLIEANGRIKVVDPHVSAGFEEVSWQSGATGYTDVRLGDFNGDGDQEILALKGSTAELFDPVVQDGATPVTGSWSITSPYKYYNMATGDIDGDGRDEIVLLRQDDAANNIKSHVLVYDGNSAGTVWTLSKDLEHGTEWLDVDMGDLNGDGKADLALMRNGETGYKDRLILILNPSAGYATLHNKSYTFDWILLELANTHKVASGDKVEIITSRKDVLGQLPSILVFRWASGVTLEDVWDGTFFPYWTDIEGGDLNGDGDDELVMYRNRTDTATTLISRNLSGAAMRAFEPAGSYSPLGGWLDLETGDLDGDGRDEIVLVRQSKYRVYNSPETSDAFVDESGSFKGPFEIGNIDGQGITSGPTLNVTPDSLSFTFNGAIPPAQALFVSNVGEGDEFDWTASVTQGGDWLSLSPSGGLTPATISLAVDPTLLSSGTYHGQIRVDAEQGIAGTPQLIDVTLSVVVTVPRLGVSPTSLTFEMDQGQLNPDPQSLSIRNIGGGTSIAWTASADVPWLEITPTSESTPTTVWVEVFGEEMAPGEHAGNIVFDAGSVVGSPYTVPITLVVNPPVLVVNPIDVEINALCSPSVRTQMLSIYQKGGGADIEWEAIAVLPPEGGMAAALRGSHGQSPERTAEGVVIGNTVLEVADWMTISPNQGTTPATVQVNLDPSGLDMGPNVATVLVVGWPSHVEDRVQWVDVTLWSPDVCLGLPLITK